MCRTDQFGVEVLPALTGLYPATAQGGPDKEFLAPDCYHFNTQLHSMVGKTIWNNLVESADSRSSDYSRPVEIKCPTSGQFISISN